MGEDAAVNLDADYVQDMQFRNTTNYPIQFRFTFNNYTSARATPYLDDGKEKIYFIFDYEIIDENDYVRIKTSEGEPIGDREYGKYDNYDVYFFDVESLTLYYIHSNR